MTQQAFHRKPDEQVEALKVPPHSIEAEQSVLGGLMLNNEAWDDVAERVTADDFFNRQHRQIFATMQKLAENDSPLDLITLSQGLEQENLLDDSGGFAYLAEVANNTPSAANILAYAEIVRERAVVRSLIGVANEIAEAGFKPEGRNSNDLLDLAESKVFAIAESRADKNEGPVELRTLLEKTVDKIEELYQSPQDGITGVSSGFHDLDKMTGGMQSSDLIIVAARPSMGKCIVSGSRVLDPETGALPTIDALVERQQATLLALGDDFKLRPAQPSAFVNDGHKPVFRVRTALGREITTTLTHPFLTGNGWLPLEKIQVGERVGVPRALPVFGQAAMPAHELKALAYFLGDGDTTQSSPRFTNANPRLRDDFAEAIVQFGTVTSQLIADDKRTPSVRVVSDVAGLAAAREAFSARLEALMEQAQLNGNGLAEQLSVSKASVSQWRNGQSVPSRELIGPLADLLGCTEKDLFPEGYEQAAKNAPNPVSCWLEQLGCRNRKAHEKAIPSVVFTLQKESLALFLNRLFACDGSLFVQGNEQVRLSYASSSRQLARDVQHLLLRFGILAKLRAKKNHLNADGHVPYELEVMEQQSLQRFIAEIGIFGKETQVAEAANMLNSKQPHNNADLLPGSVCDYVLARKGERSWPQIFSAAGKTCPPGYNPHLQGESRRLLSRRRCAEFAQLLQDDYLQILSESDLYWDEVVSIEPLGLQQVYDLTVPELHNFVAEDICVHNTTFAMNLCENAALAQDKPVLVFSLEMPSEQIIMRMLASVGRVEQTKIRTGQLEDDDWTRVSSAMGVMLEKGQLYVDDSSGLTPTEVRSRARRVAKEAGGLSMIMVDYLQLMQVPALADNRTLEIAEISRSLKALAKELQVPVIALSQLNRSLEQRADKRPVNSDLRESGSIEQDADLIMFIYRDEVYNDDSQDKGTAEIIIGKQRNGPIGKVRLTFQGQFSRFDNYAGPAMDEEY